MAQQYTDDEKQMFLDILAQTGIERRGREAIGCSHEVIRQWRKNDAAFAQGYVDALDTASDTLFEEARRRAYEGVEREKVIGSGDSARFITEVQYSDTLMLALLKATRPEQFADRTKSELSGPGGAPLNDFNETTAAARITALLDAAARRRAAGTPGEDPDPFS
jgi:hypothetical protein